MEEQLLAVAAGAALAGLFGLLGAYVNHTREKERWLIRTRWDAYVTLLTEVDLAIRMKAARRAIASRPDEMDEYLDVLDRVLTAHAAVWMSGPQAVAETANRLMTLAMKDWPSAAPDHADERAKEFREIRDEYVTVARHAIGA